MDKGLPQSNCVQDSEHDLSAEDLLAQQSNKPSNQTACFDLLKDVVAYVDVWSNSQDNNYTWAFSKQLLMMGATVCRTFRKNVTHVIFKDGLESTWNKATSTGVKLVSVLWVDNCVKNQTRLDEALYPVRFDPRTTTNYCNRKRRWHRPVCVYNLEDEGSREKRLQKKLEKLTRQMDYQKSVATGPDCLILAVDDEGQPVFSHKRTRSPVLDRVKPMADRLQEMKALRENISLTDSQMLSQSRSPVGSASPLQCPSNVPSCSLFNILFGEESGPGAEEMSTPKRCHSFVADSDVSLQSGRVKSKKRSTSEKDTPLSCAVVQETPDSSLLRSSNTAESNRSQRRAPTLRRKRFENVYVSNRNREEGGQCPTSTGSSLDLTDVFPLQLCTDSETQSSSANVGSPMDAQSKTSSNSQDKSACSERKSSGVRSLISGDIQVISEACMEETNSERWKTPNRIGEDIAGQEEGVVPVVCSSAAGRMDLHSQQSAATSLVFETTSRKRPRIDSIRETPGSSGSRKKQKLQLMPESPSSGMILDSISPFDDYFLPENVQELAPRNQEVINRVSALLSTPTTSINSRQESLDGSKITGDIIVSLDDPNRASSNPQQQRIDKEPQVDPQTNETCGTAVAQTIPSSSSTNNKRSVKKFRHYSVKQAGYLAKVAYVTHVVRQDSPRPPCEQDKTDTDTDSTRSDLCGHDASSDDRLVQDIELGEERSTRNTNIPSFPDVVEVTSQQGPMPKENPLDSRHQGKVPSGVERAKKGLRRSGRLKLPVPMQESERPKKAGMQNVPRAVVVKRPACRTRRGAVSGRGRASHVPAAHHQQTRSLVLTSLHAEERSRAQRALRQLGGFTLHDDVQEGTSHVVLGSPRRTLNALLGIARGCWLLSLAWVVESVECGRWLEEEPYEMSDTFPAAQVRRRERCGGTANRLLADTPPMFVSHHSDPPAAVLCALITLSGGSASRTLRQACVHVGSYPARTRRAALQLVSEKWLLDCITYNEVRPMEDYQPDNLDK